MREQEQSARCVLYALLATLAGCAAGVSGSSSSHVPVTENETSSGSGSSGSGGPTVGLSDPSTPVLGTPAPSTPTTPTTGQDPGTSTPGTDIPESTQPPPTTRTGTAVLHWSAPTTNTDGTPVTGLAGYVIQYGNSPKLMAQRTEIADPGTITHTLTGLGSGTWYFAVTSYTAAGVESALSNIASKTIE